ncbi:MAG: endolytic transglycosylase MltG [Clostridiales bacterium]|nr:endolytic transglycosylase MltG [Clostridiales bacterium]
MEEKNIPEQDTLPVSPGETAPVTEPEAEEVPVIEALTFTSEEPIPEQPEEASQTADEAELPSAETLPVDGTPADSVQEEAPAAPSEAAEVEEQSESPAADSPADANTPEAPIESASAVDLSILDDPELEEVLFAEETPVPAPDKDFHETNGQEFEEMMDAPAPEQKSPVSERPPRKGRPKRKKGEGLLGIPNMLVTVVWLALILAIGVTAGRMLWVCAADVLAFGREDKPVTVTIYESDTMDDIIEKLYHNGLIRYRSLFKLYADISHADEDIDPGIYDLNTRYDYHALVNMMSASSSRTVVEGVLIPEGYTCRQIFALLEEKRICTAQDLAAYAANGELKDYWFLENVERGQGYCLEGFLFPDTYDFYKNSTPREVLEKLLDNFDRRFDKEMRAQIETLNANVTGGGYGVREVAIVASMIEKEAAAPAEAPAIAGVIYNRLFRWEGTPAYLNIDASIVYALDGKTDLTREDLQVDSPYNTYTHTGLTPTPISNPGLSSLRAALNPENHNYYYYVLNPETGMHTFSTTYEEHSANVAAYAEGQ